MSFFDVLRSLLLAMALVSAFTTTVGCAGASSDDSAQGEADLTNDPLARIRAAVKDIDQPHVVFAAEVKAPTENAGDGTGTAPTTLYGVDWFQKWGGGVTSDHDWSKGTAEGQRCMWASVARFDAILEAAPELKASVGSFYNLNEDYAGKSAAGDAAFGDAKAARVEAWRPDLSKWVSQTAKDGSCWLPTRKMVADYAACQAQTTAPPEGCLASSQ